MSAWCAINGFDGASSFLRHHSSEEMQHMNKIFDYLVDNDVMPILNPVEVTKTKFESLESVLREAHGHEKIITDQINRLSHIAIESQDYTTFHFLQWYVFEQQEEEKLFQFVLNKVNLVKDSRSGSLLLDKDLMEMSKQKKI
jgi:ferritin